MNMFLRAASSTWVGTTCNISNSQVIKKYVASARYTSNYLLSSLSFSLKYNISKRNLSSLVSAHSFTTFEVNNATARSSKSLKNNKFESFYPAVYYSKRRVFGASNLNKVGYKAEELRVYDKSHFQVEERSSRLENKKNNNVDSKLMSRNLDFCSCNITGGAYRDNRALMDRSGCALLELKSGKLLSKTYKSHSVSTEEVNVLKKGSLINRRICDSNRLPIFSYSPTKTYMCTSLGRRCMSTEGNRKSGPIISWKLAFLTSGLCVVLVCYVVYEQGRLSEQNIAKVEESTIGKPKLGGPWCLVDQNGEVVCDSDFKGMYQLLYFGFSFCPDVCPQELEKMAVVIEALDEKYGNNVVQPLFITVDPHRDTCAQLREYCKQFHKRLIGLTGTTQQIKNITKLFRVYYNPSIQTNDKDYLIDHSIIQYFMDKNGQFKHFFGKNLTPQEIITKISAIIDHDKSLKQKKGTIEDA